MSESNPIKKSVDYFFSQPYSLSVGSDGMGDCIRPTKRKDGKPRRILGLNTEVNPLLNVQGSLRSDL